MLSNAYSFVDVEGSPHFVNLSPAVFVAELGSSQSQKLSKVNASRLIIIKFSQNLVDELVLASKAQLLKGSLELLGVNDSTKIAVEDIEGSLNVSDLFDGDSKSSVIFSSPHFFLGSLGLPCCRLRGSFGLNLAHSLKYLIV